MPVFRFVKDLLGRKEEAAAARTVGLDELPALIDAEIASIRERTGPAFEEPASEVRQAIADLEGLVGRLARADWDAAIHPKLEQISRTTLPAFVRAMESCLSRTLPDDPHEFYAASTALLKCLISALRGQGRYLRAVLPDEMQAVKAGVDVVGRAVNAMTATLADEKNDLAALEALRGRVDRIGGLEAEEQDALRRSGEAAAQLETIAGDRTATEGELATLNDSPAARALDARRSEVERLTAAAESLASGHRAHSEGLIQALRRAERLLAKRGDRQAATRLHHLQSALADPLPADGAALSSSLVGGLAVVQDLVAAGEITPKEGDQAFGDPAAVAASVAARIDEQARLAEELAQLEREVATSPVAQERERLSGRLRQLGHRASALDAERADLARVAGQKATERAALLAGLDEELETVFAGRVRLGAEDT